MYVNMNITGCLHVGVQSNQLGPDEIRTPQ